MTRGISIAIDGPAGAGKSTVSKLLAQAANLELLDTGAMYRAYTWAWIHDRQHDPSALLETSMENHEIEVSYEAGKTAVRCDGRDISAEIRGAEVTALVSEVAAQPFVRVKAVALQRQIVEKAQAEGMGVVLEGRDIGTTVLPSATLKFFLTANVEARAQRRAAEIGADSEQVRDELEARDKVDSQRETSPLRAAEDAIHIDATGLTPQEVVNIMMGAIDGHRTI
jgi:cytidylate kinase